MTAYAKHLILLLLPLLIIGCGDKGSLDGNFTIETSAIKNSIKNGGEIAISLKAKKNIAIDSVVYDLDGQRLGSNKDTGKYTTTLTSPKLGGRTLTATISTPDGTTTATQKINILHTKAPKVYGYKIINRYPHQTDAYTQGLEFVGDTLYESNGSYGESTLRKLDYKTGAVLKEIKLDDSYFAEGMTIMGDNIYQLTWQKNTGFIYNKDTFEKTGTFTYNKSKEGWGLTNDGTVIYKSDGTSKIWTLDPSNLSEQSYIEPTHNNGIMSQLNELEFIDGKIYANTYQRESIAIIDPKTGALEALINLKGLNKEVQSGLDPDNEVLNGIAYKANEGRLFVTGKHWNTLFEIEVVEK
ncbi:glutaminyl-peptide cyclotransferase [Dokdonia sp. R86516]|uniref:glutaminyl-peptide cyclotransferase n=1 Tax=Dokdonia sp. R86516 TaxID=3093856 RepID=UPI0037C6122E